MLTNPTQSYSNFRQLKVPNDFDSWPGVIAPLFLFSLVNETFLKSAVKTRYIRARQLKNNESIHNGIFLIVLTLYT